MITIKDSDYWGTKASALVVTVNTVGVMGKGIALEFRELFPKMYYEYKKLRCRGAIATGHMWVYIENNPLIICFPTKQYWRNPSKIEWIDEGLEDLKLTIKLYGIKSINIPALGCSMVA